MKVRMTLVIRDKTSIATHHIMNYQLTSYSDDPFEAVSLFVETDDSTRERDLKLKFYDRDGVNLPYIFKTYLPTRKIIIVRLSKMVMKGEEFSYTMEYDAPETDRYYQYYCQGKVGLLTCILDYPNDMPPKSQPHGSPTALKVTNVKEMSLQRSFIL